MLLSKEEINVLRLTSADAFELVAKAESAILAKLASAELPEPIGAYEEVVGVEQFHGFPSEIIEMRDAYSADQLRQAFAQGAASQLSAEPEAWTWNTKSQHDGFLDAHFQFSKPIDDQRIVDLCPLFTLKEPK